MSGTPPVILAIDAATMAGWAVGRAGDPAKGIIPISGSHRFAKPGSSSGAISAGAMRWLTTMIQTHDPDEIVIEAPLPVAATSGRTTSRTSEVLIGIPFTLAGTAHLHGKHRISVERVADVRRHFIGKNPKGEVGKKLTHDKCLALGWIQPDDEDQGYDRSDGLALWSYAEHLLAPKIARPVDDLTVSALVRSRRAA